MEKKKDINMTTNAQTPSVNPGTYSPITVYNQDSLGTLILGFIACVLLFRLVRREQNNTK